MIKFGDFVVDRADARLLQNGQEVAIEPKVFELLLLLIDNANRVVSRDKIMDDIWSGSIVTDNAINKQLGNLRKLLNDNPKAPRFIQTVPKQGYRFIAPLTELTDENVQSSAPSNNETTPTINRPLTIASLLILAVVLIIVAWQLFKPSPLVSAKRHTLELTRLEGQEFSARTAPNGQAIYFLRKQLNGSTNEIWYKDLLTGDEAQVTTPVNHVQRLIAITQSTDAIPSKLLYLVQNGKHCQVMQADIIVTTRLGETHQLMDCTGHWVSDIDYIRSRQQLIYAIGSNNEPQKIYLFDIGSNLQQLLTQPTPEGMGNHSFDLSDNEQQLLIMQTGVNRHTNLFVLHLQSNTLTKQVTLPYFASEAMWHRDGKQIYYFGPPPSNRILLSKLSGEQQSTVVSASDYLSRDMKRLTNGDLLFSTQKRNYNNHWLFTDNNTLKPNNSTVYDMSPALYHHSQRYLFVSKRSGKSQLYLGNLNNGTAKLLSNFAPYNVFWHLAVSPDDKHLLIATLNDVWLVPLTGESISLTEDNLIHTGTQAIHELNWLDNNTVAMTLSQTQGALIKTIVQDSQWQTISPQWRQIMTDEQHKNLMYFVEANSHKLYRAISTVDKLADIDNTEFVFTGVTLPENAMNTRVFNGSLYYAVTANDKATINQINLAQPQTIKAHALHRIYGFDINARGLLVSELFSIDGDIHRTVTGH